MPNPTLYDNFSQVRQYIDQNQVDLSSYVTKDELNEMSYATTSQLPVIDENIIPKANNTYNLGSSAYKYKYTYTNNIGAPSTGLVIRLGDYNRFTFTDKDIHPVYSSTTTLGTAAAPWSYTYTKNLILNGSDVNNVFPTYAYVVDYVDQHGGGGSTVIDENIIPKANNTYTLGSASYLYSSIYTNKIQTTNNGMWVDFEGNHRFLFTNYAFRPNENNKSTLGNANNQYATVYTYNINLNQSQIKQDEYSIGFNVNGNNTMRMFVDSFRPWVDKGATLGSSSTQWSTTYTSNLYINGTNIESRFDNLIWTGTADQYEALSDYTTYQIYMIKES